MDIQAAAKKIIDEANSRSRGAASIYLAENIRFHQDKCRKIVHARVKPAGWTLGKHTELIQMLISAQSERHALQVAA
ncbi:hypothetical protein [Pararhizobium sp. DWP1-1-3]|uniref:hypothetical protein n=1 Tax=Pararhizobium sp. DWP1-1-3 TaxID=2804652 RepID=UPI003CFB8058